jgi:hypothetical protein
VPSSTDLRIEEITAAIRSLCRGPFDPEMETNLKRLAKELRTVIRQHVKMAEGSLTAKGAAINRRDPELKAK